VAGARTTQIRFAALRLWANAARHWLELFVLPAFSWKLIAHRHQSSQPPDPLAEPWLPCTACSSSSNGMASLLPRFLSLAPQSLSNALLHLFFCLLPSERVCPFTVVLESFPGPFPFFPSHLPVPDPYPILLSASPRLIYLSYHRTLFTPIPFLL
jgi:hypothetical protein